MIGLRGARERDGQGWWRKSVFISTIAHGYLTVIISIVLSTSGLDSGVVVGWHWEREGERRDSPGLVHDLPQHSHRVVVAHVLKVDVVHLRAT